MALIRIGSVADNKIDHNAIMNKSYVMTKAGVMLSGVLWPQHQNELYTLTDVVGVPEENRTLNDLDIMWAALVIWFLQQRRLEHIIMVDYESPFIARHYEKLVLKKSDDRKSQPEKFYHVNMNEPVATGKTES